MGKIVVTLFFLFPLLLAAQPVQKNAVSETPVVAAPSFSLRGVHVSYGEFHDKISVAWDDASVRTYQIFRSNFKDRDFSLVAQVDALFWNDTTALSGVKYWYKIIPLPPQDDVRLFFREYPPKIKRDYSSLWWLLMASCLLPWGARMFWNGFSPY